MKRRMISRVAKLMVVPMVVTTVFSAPVLSFAEGRSEVREIFSLDEIVPEGGIVNYDEIITEDEMAAGEEITIDEAAVEEFLAANPDFATEGAIIFENLDEAPLVPEEVYEGIGEDEEATGGVTYESPDYIPACVLGGDMPDYNTPVKNQSVYWTTVSTNGKVIKRTRPVTFETCWAFGSVGAMETSSNMQNGISGSDPAAPDLSERALVYYAYNNNNTSVDKDGNPIMRDPLATKNDPYGPLEKDQNYLTISMTSKSTDVATTTQDFAFGGNPQFAMDTFAQGVGPTDESLARYSESVSTTNLKEDYHKNEAFIRNLVRCSSAVKYSSDYYLKSARYLNMAQKDVVKKMILKFGSVVTMIYYKQDGLVSANLIRGDEAYPQYFFHRESSAANHVIQLVGWDDNIEATVKDSAGKPKKIKGAWLCKNTYGADWNVSSLGYPSDNGYFWVSYATTDVKGSNTSGETDRRGYTFEAEPKDKSAGVLTNRQYQYDGSAFNKELEEGTTYANVFKTANPVTKTVKEYLRSVLIKVATPGAVYSVQLYENPDTNSDGMIIPDTGKKLLSKPVFGTVEEAGYYNVDLGRGIALGHGVNVAVVVTLYERSAEGDYPKLYGSISGSYRMVVQSDGLKPNDEEGKYTYGFFKGINTSSDGHSFYKDSRGGWHDFHKDATGAPRIKLRTVQSTADEAYAAPESVDVNVALEFNANEGTCSSASKVIKVGSALGTLPVPERYGYDFTGWYTKASGGSKVTAETVCNFAYDKKVYAHWTPKNLTVTFDANGGYTVIKEKPVVFDDVYDELPQSLRNKYYSFAGWFTAKDGGVEISDISKVSIGENHTLYAHWDKLSDDSKVEQIAGGSVSDNVVTYDITMVKSSKTSVLKEIIKKVREDGRDYSVISSDKRIAAASKTGVISAKRVGSCVITIFKPTAGLTYNLNVTVEAPAYAKKTIRMNTGELYDLNFSGTSLSEEYSISTKQQKYAKVYDGGIVEGVAKGKAYVTVMAGGKKYKAAVYVYNPSISGKYETCIDGKIRFKIKNGYGKTTWSVEPGTGSASITSKGILKGLGEGTVTVVAVNNGRTMRREVVIYD